jgi:phosphoribosyl-AMP cyclohydrolase
MRESEIKELFEKGELVPAIVQQYDSGEVLMLAYVNRASLEKMLETGYTWFYSRSRQELWNKGASSGNLQKVVELYADCDHDTLLIKADQKGVACHTGQRSCFFNKIEVEK